MTILILEGLSMIGLTCLAFCFVYLIAYISYILMIVGNVIFIKRIPEDMLTNVYDAYWREIERRNDDYYKNL